MRRSAVGSRGDRFVGKLTVEDDRYLKKIQEILLAEPCRGVPIEPCQLLSHMYIGNQNNAESLCLLRRLGITHVLNTAGFKGRRAEPDVSPYEGLNIDYLEFKAEDNDGYNITRHFPEAFAFLDKVERKGGKCLVHCAMGVNRSAATCVGYLIHKKWTLLEAIRLIKEKRRVALSNVGFRWQLVKFARSKGQLDKLEEADKPRPRDWVEEEVVYMYDSKPEPVDRFPEFGRPVKDKPKSPEDFANMDVLTKCINDTLARESQRKARVERRFVTREWQDRQ